MARIRRKRTGFPRSIARFLYLQGSCGDLTLTAVSRDQMDIAMGEDFVSFTRERSGELRDALQRFIDLARFTDEELLDIEDVQVTSAGVSIEQVVVEERRPRRKSATR